MKLHELSPAPGSTKDAKRVGRGHGSGHGKTSARVIRVRRQERASGPRVGFEGWPDAPSRRVPKRGFNNIFATKFAVVNLADLERVFSDGQVVDIEALRQAGLIKKPLDGVKVLGNGELSKKLTVKVNAYSETAKAKIEAAGGTAEII